MNPDFKRELRQFLQDLFHQTNKPDEQFRAIDRSLAERRLSDPAYDTIQAALTGAVERFNSEHVLAVAEGRDTKDEIIRRAKTSAQAEGLLEKLPYETGRKLRAAEESHVRNWI